MLKVCSPAARTNEVALRTTNRTRAFSTRRGTKAAKNGQGDHGVRPLIMRHFSGAQTQVQMRSTPHTMFETSSFARAVAVRRSSRVVPRLGESGSYSVIGTGPSSTLTFDPLF